MALSAQEKNDIAQGIQIAAAFLPAPFNFLVFPLLAGITADLTRIRFPRGPNIGSVVQQLLDLEARGLSARVSRDPFFGDTVISTADQAQFLTELVRNAALRRVAAEQDSSRLFLQRRALIEGLEESAEERGFARAVDPSLRGGVFRPGPEQPLQFIEGDFLA